MEYENILKKECTFHNFQLILKASLPHGDTISFNKIAKTIALKGKRK